MPPIEAATYLTELNSANPIGATDQRSTSDDHHRLLKAVLQATFPGMSGRAWRTSVKGADFSVVLNDNTVLFNCTASLTVNPAAAAVLGNGHVFAVYANGGNVIIDPDTAELINGTPTLFIPAGGFALVFCSGTEFYSIGSQLAAEFSSQLFSGTGAQTVFTLPSAPPGINSTQLFISGVRQTPEVSYTLSGVTITFPVAPPLGTNNILVTWLTLGTVSNTPSNESVTLEKLHSGLLATQAEAVAGLLNTKLMTPLGTAQAIAALTAASPQIWLANTVGTAFASALTFATAGAWSAYTQVNIAARIAAIYTGSLANVRAVTVLTKLKMIAGAGPIQQRSSVAFSANNTDLQDNVRQQVIQMGAGGADSMGAADVSELIVPVTISGANAFIYYATRRELGDHAAEDWSAYITGVHVS